MAMATIAFLFLAFFFSILSPLAFMQEVEDEAGFMTWLDLT
jgi:hypothetical protein